MRKTLLLLLAATACGQSPVRPYVASHKAEILQELTALVAIPNVASDKSGIQRNVEALRQAMDKRGLHTRLLETPSAPPVLYGEMVVPGAKQTLVFYAHYDGQPVDPKDWTVTKPFTPVLVGDRLYGRSTSDDKAAIVAMLTALDALKSNGVRPSSNLKFFFEGEEEAGSPHLEQTVHDNAALLGADLWLICDGPVHQNGQQQVYFGARGISALEITVFGPNHELHSGHYGNWAPNPAMLLARLLTSMKDETGRVLIDGFYENVQPLGTPEKEALAAAPDFDGPLQRELGLARTEGHGRTLMELINGPSLNINGLQSAAVGSLARNVIPSTATASIDIRLVKAMDPRRTYDRVVAHIRKQGFTVDTNGDGKPEGGASVRVLYKGGYAAARTSMDLPISRRVVSAIGSARGPVVRMPMLGGSVPLYIFEQQLHTPMIGIPIANHDNNQHSANENIRLDNLWNGVETMAALMTMP